MEERIIKDINNLLTQLFQKMKEAGYEWDAEKKELKEIIDEKQIKKKNLQDNSFRKMFEQKQVIDCPDSLPKDNWELIHEFVNKFRRIPKDEDELNVLIEYVLKRQKPDWSEEDEAMLNRLIGVLDGTNKEDYHEAWEEKFLPWLKSLKDRPQNKTYYWTKNEIKFAISDYIRGVESYEKMVEKLRCLKPQNTWKPSDEQIEALEHFVRSIGECGFASPYDSNTKLIYSLLSELKNLREG